ncbi:MAG TPA: hypothetical protein VM936_06010 [Pyrinomonadaceae bacterium]|jgi:hypothetical protein|nr:hypothetical protein [Pyrinomonadaceae bacterium]
MTSEANQQESVHGVFRRGVTRDMFEETAAELGFVKHDTWEAQGEGQSYEQVWTTPDKARAVNYVEDPLSRMSYIHLRGADLDELREEFDEKLATFWPDEIIGIFYEMRGHSDIVDNIYRLAILFPEYDPQVFHIFEGAATDPPDPKLRLAGLDALAYRTWPQSRAVVERVARDDKDEEVREQAAKILTLWDAPGQQSPSP